MALRGGSSLKTTVRFLFSVTDTMIVLIDGCISTVLCTIALVRRYIHEFLHFMERTSSMSYSIHEILHSFICVFPDNGPFHDCTIRIIYGSENRMQSILYRTNDNKILIEDLCSDKSILS